ncbi:unnamed protein product [Peronospora effusa]|nr:unnamed protein product [Peronospora effusa]
MVRVPGSSGDSGFHRESLREAVKVKIEPGIEASAAKGSPQTCEEKRSPDHQRFGRGADEQKTKEEDRSLDLEEKPLPPPQVLLRTPADRAAKRDPLDKNPSVITEGNLSKTTPNSKKKKKNSKPSRVKMKAPE